MKTIKQIARFINHKRKPLMERVKQRILANPNNFSMHTWSKKTSCGTVGCIAYHVCVESIPSFSHNEILEIPSISIIASDILSKELDVSRFCVFNLFYVENWDEDLLAKWDASILGGDATRWKLAEIACEAIDRFVANPIIFGN
jgi:hypothetical protein